jgi:PAS domain S-box-containing protein
MLKVRKNLCIKELSEDEFLENDAQKKEKSYHLFMKHIKEFIGFWFDENFVPKFIDGAVKDITGYDKEDFYSKNIKWTELILPEDKQLVLENIKRISSNPGLSSRIEYRIRKKDGEIRWVREVTYPRSANLKMKGHFQGFIRDIHEHKIAEIRKEKFEDARLKEIHHRIKNNLQIISSLLSLEAERFNDVQMLEAFRESQNRVASMALIHEELYRSTDTNKLDFSAYLKKLIKELLNSYTKESINISLRMNLEQVYLGMDTAIPLGIIVNELVSNSFKHAFPGGKEGKIYITLCKAKDYRQHIEESNIPQVDTECQEKVERNLQFILQIKDNGKGIPGKIDFYRSDSLGFQLVNILVEQIDGCIELRRDKGTEFTIWFND